MSSLRIERIIEDPQSKRARQFIAENGPWGYINEVHSALRGCWAAKGDNGQGLLLTQEAANDMLSDEAITLGERRPFDMLAYTENKNLAIALTDSQHLADLWFDYSGIPDSERNKARKEAWNETVIHFSRYFDPLPGRDATTHGKKPSEEQKRIAERKRHVHRMRELGYPGVIEAFYPAKNVLAGIGAEDRYGIAQTLGGGFYHIRDDEYKPELGYELIDDYPNHADLGMKAVRPSDVADRWMAMKMIDLFGSALEDDEEVLAADARGLSMSDDELSHYFYALGRDVGEKVKHPINLRLPDFMGEPGNFHPPVRIPTLKDVKDFALSETIDYSTYCLVDFVSQYIDIGRLPEKALAVTRDSFVAGIEDAGVNANYYNGKAFERHLDKNKDTLTSIHLLKPPVQVYAETVLTSDEIAHLKKRSAEIREIRDSEGEKVFTIENSVQAALVEMDGTTPESIRLQELFDQIFELQKEGGAPPEMMVQALEQISAPARGKPSPFSHNKDLAISSLGNSKLESCGEDDPEADELADAGQPPNLSGQKKKNTVIPMIPQIPKVTAFGI